MTADDAPMVGGYRVERGRTDMFFLVDATGRSCPFWPIGDGRWKGLPPTGDAYIVRDIGDVPDADLVMARELVEAAGSDPPE